MDSQEQFLWAGALYATGDDPSFAALAFRGWVTTVRRGVVVARVADE
jgi:hypothetical protein